MSATDLAAPLRLGVAGATGRMGRRVLALGRADARFTPAAAIGSPASHGRSIDGLVVSGATEVLDLCDVIVDFSTPAGSQTVADAAAGRGGPALVIGTTGFDAAGEAAVARAARQIAIVRSGNFSVAVNLLADLVERAARRLDGEDWDIEILEAHHRHKRDAPSGTALMLGEAAALGRGADLTHLAEQGREGHRGARTSGAIGFASLRAGGIVGEHLVLFASDDEVLSLSHSARNRDIFARGALTAAAWVVDRAPGLYGMSDVLGLAD